MPLSIGLYLIVYLPLIIVLYVTSLNATNYWFVSYFFKWQYLLVSMRLSCMPLVLALYLTSFMPLIIGLYLTFLYVMNYWFVS